MQQAHAESSGTAECVAALVYVYDHTARELANRLAEAHHHHHDLSVAAMQVHLDHSSCMEVALLRGDTREVNHFAEHVIAERGVRHGRLVAVPVEVKEETHPHGNDRAKKHPHYDSALAPSGLRVTQFSVLRKLARHGSRVKALFCAKYILKKSLKDFGISRMGGSLAARTGHKSNLLNGFDFFPIRHHS